MNQITLTTEPSDADRDAIEDGLRQYNRGWVEGDYLPLSLLMHDDDGTLVAGLDGATRWQWLKIGRLWVSKELRGQGVGSRLLEMAEEEALRRGAHSAWLDTHGWQAPEFYRKHGYEVFGELDAYPNEHPRYFMRKRLRSPDDDENDAW